MRTFWVALSCLLVTACSVCHPYPELSNEPVYNNNRTENYRPASGRVFHVAGFDIKEGQQMRDFFDDFDVPLHTSYSGNTVVWTYAVDYDAVDDEGKIVRCCDVNGYKRPLCELKVEFDHTYVSNATSNCR